MKYLILPFICSLFMLHAQAQNQKYKQMVGDELLELSGGAAKETKEVQQVVNDLFKSIKTAIEEADQMAEELTNAEQNGQVLDKEAKENIKKRIEAIHKVYTKITRDERHYKNVLYNSSNDANRIVSNTNQVLQREKAEYKKTEQYVKRLSNKSSLTEDEENALRNLRTQLNLRRIIIETLEQFNSEMKNFKQNHSISKEKIESFFSQIKYSSETTGLMIEVLDLSIKTEMIKENVKAIQEIDKYTREMYESLDKLGRSLDVLKNIAQKYQ